LPTAEEPGYRVLGVIEDYRWEGEFGAPHHTLFELLDPDATDGYPAESLLMRMRPGSGGTEEESLLHALRACAPGWNFRIAALESMRADRHREQLAVPIIGLVVAGFLVLTVGLGLVGVLWQNVTRRTQEIGVRRAMGATAAQVRGQILGEMIALATAAILLGTLVVVQAPLLGLFPALSWSEYALALVLATVLVLGLVVVCGLYPSWLATRIGPARALQYE
jgi:putative ABC transport system permease protein